MSVFRRTHLGSFRTAAAAAEAWCAPGPPRRRNEAPTLDSAPPGPLHLTAPSAAAAAAALCRRDDAARKAGLKTVNFPREGAGEVRADPLQRGQGRRVRPAAPGERVITRATEAAAAFEGVAFSRRCPATGACFFSAKLRGRPLGEFGTAVAAAEAWCAFSPSGSEPLTPLRRRITRSSPALRS